MEQLDLMGFPPAAGRGEIHRLFFALWPDDSTRRGIATAAAHLKAEHVPRGRWLGAHRYHLTLQFLGDFDRLRDSLVDDACRAAASVRSPAFDLTLDHAGSFRNREVPWWLGCESMPGGLQRLWDALGLALARAGVRTHASGSLKPHVTVLREADVPLPVTAITPIAWPVREFVLIHSQLGSQNVYTELRRWPLVG